MVEDGKIELSQLIYPGIYYIFLYFVIWIKWIFNYKIQKMLKNIMNFVGMINYDKKVNNQILAFLFILFNFRT